MPPLLGCFWPGSKRSREKGRDNEHSSKRSGAARSDKAAHAAAGSSHHSGGMAEAAAASLLVVKEGRQGGHPWKQLASDRTSPSLCDTAIGTHQGIHPDTPNSSCVSGTEFARLENARLKAENARLKEILAASVAHPRAHSLDSRPPFSILAPHGSTAAEASPQDPLTPVPSAQQPQRVSAGELRTPKAAAAAAAEGGGRRSTDSLPSSGMDAAAGVAADSQCEQQQHPQQPAWLQRQIVGSALSTVSEAAHHQHQQQQQLQQLYHNQQQGSCGSGAPSPHCESAQGHTCEPSPSMNLVTLEALQGNAQAHAVPMALLLLAGSVEEYEEDTVQQPPSPIAEESRSPTSSQIDLTPQRSMPSSLPFSEALPDVNVYEMASCVWLNDAFMHCMEAHTKQAAISATNRTINSNLTFQRHMVGFCKNLALGKQGPICFWSVFFPTAGPAQVDRICMWPCELLDTDGACTGHPGGVFRAIMVSTETGLSMDAQRNVLLQQHMAYQFAPCMVTVLDTEGCILTQNAESVACLGCHSKEHQVCTAPDSPSTMDASQHRHKAGLPQQQQQPLSYLKELFYDQEDLLVEMQEALEGQEPYIDRMEIRSPLLRTWLGASEGQEIWHRVHVIRLTDPISRQQQYCLSQVDVTATIEAERHVLQLQQQQSALLREILPQQVIEHLLMHKSAMVAGSAPSVQAPSSRPTATSPVHTTATATHTCSSALPDPPTPSACISSSQPTASHPTATQPTTTQPTATQPTTTQSTATQPTTTPPTVADTNASARGSEVPDVDAQPNLDTPRLHSPPHALPRVITTATLTPTPPAHTAAAATCDAHSAIDASGSHAQQPPLSSPPHTGNEPSAIDASCTCAQSGGTAGASPVCTSPAVSVELHGQQSMSPHSVLGSMGSAPAENHYQQQQQQQQRVPAHFRRHSVACTAQKSRRTDKRSMDEAAQHAMGPWALLTPTSSQQQQQQQQGHLPSPSSRKSVGVLGAPQEDVPKFSGWRDRSTRAGSMYFHAPRRDASFGSQDRASQKGAESGGIGIRLPARSFSLDRHCTGIAAVAAAWPSMSMEQQPSLTGTESLVTSSQVATSPRLGSHAASTNSLQMAAAGSECASACTLMPHASESGRVWLTQQDVMELATFHDEVTILFADIKGFTSLVNRLHPSQVMLFLNSLYSVWDSLLESFGVYKVETIGDCYMAAAGLFCYDEATGTKRLGGHDPRHAHTILEFAKAMLWSSQAIKTPLGDTVQVRVGIHSGPCSSGVVGQRMPRFCLFGDTVNTANRMESNGVPGCIHASDSTVKLLPCEPWRPVVGGIMAKGKGLMHTSLLPVLSGTAFAEASRIAEEDAAQHGAAQRVSQDGGASQPLPTKLDGAPTAGFPLARPDKADVQCVQEQGSFVSALSRTTDSTLPPYSQSELSTFTSGPHGLAPTSSPHTSHPTIPPTQPAAPPPSSSAPVLPTPISSSPLPPPHTAALPASAHPDPLLPRSTSNPAPPSATTIATCAHGAAVAHTAGGDVCGVEDAVAGGGGGGGDAVQPSGHSCSAPQQAPPHTAHSVHSAQHAQRAQHAHQLPGAALQLALLHQRQHSVNAHAQGAHPATPLHAFSMESHPSSDGSVTGTFTLHASSAAIDTPGTAPPTPSPFQLHQPHHHRHKQSENSHHHHHHQQQQQQQQQADESGRMCAAATSHNLPPASASMETSAAVPQPPAALLQHAPPPTTAAAAAPASLEGGHSAHKHSSDGARTQQAHSHAWPPSCDSSTHSARGARALLDSSSAAPHPNAVEAVHSTRVHTSDDGGARALLSSSEIGARAHASDDGGARARCSSGSAHAQPHARASKDSSVHSSSAMSAVRAPATPSPRESAALAHAHEHAHVQSGFHAGGDTVVAGAADVSAGAPPAAAAAAADGAGAVAPPKGDVARGVGLLQRGLAAAPAGGGRGTAAAAGEGARGTETKGGTLAKGQSLAEVGEVVLPTPTPTAPGAAAATPPATAAAGAAAAAAAAAAEPGTQGDRPSKGVKFVDVPDASATVGAATDPWPLSPTGGAQQDTKESSTLSSPQPAFSSRPSSTSPRPSTGGQPMFPISLPSSHPCTRETSRVQPPALEPLLQESSREVLPSSCDEGNLDPLAAAEQDEERALQCLASRTTTCSSGGGGNWVVEQFLGGCRGHSNDAIDSNHKLPVVPYFSTAQPLSGGLHQEGEHARGSAQHSVHSAHAVPQTHTQLSPFAACPWGLTRSTSGRLMDAHHDPATPANSSATNTQCDTATLAHSGAAPACGAAVREPAVRPMRGAHSAQHSTQHSTLGVYAQSASSAPTPTATAVTQPFSAQPCASQPLPQQQQQHALLRHAHEPMMHSVHSMHSAPSTGHRQRASCDGSALLMSTGQQLYLSGNLSGCGSANMSGHTFMHSSAAYAQNTSGSLFSHHEQLQQPLQQQQQCRQLYHQPHQHHKRSSGGDEYVVGQPQGPHTVCSSHNVHQRSSGGGEHVAGHRQLGPHTVCSSHNVHLMSGLYSCAITPTHNHHHQQQQHCSSAHSGGTHGSGAHAGAPSSAHSGTHGGGAQHSGGVHSSTHSGHDSSSMYSGGVHSGGLHSGGWGGEVPAGATPRRAKGEHAESGHIHPKGLSERGEGAGVASPLDSCQKLVDSVTSRVLQQLQESRPEPQAQPTPQPTNRSPWASRRSIDVSSFQSRPSCDALGSSAYAGTRRRERDASRSIDAPGMVMPFMRRLSGSLHARTHGGAHMGTLHPAAHTHGASRSTALSSRHACVPPHTDSSAGTL